VAEERRGEIEQMTDCKSCDDSRCTGQERRPGEGQEDYLDRRRLLARLCRIRHKILVLSGKGGVGKSTVAVNLATALALAGKRVGVLDVDIHGPSVPKLLHLEGSEIAGGVDALLPVETRFGEGALSVMSIGFLLRGRDDAVIWRGPRKFGVIKQFLRDVEWGELDYLIIDSPPGTGDEPLAVAQLIENADGALVVTTPQQVAVQDVRRCIVFCRQLELPVLGVVENLSGFSCPSREMAAEMDVPFLAAIPMDPEVVSSGDDGTPIVQARPHSEAAKAFGRMVRALLEPELRQVGTHPKQAPAGQPMRIAVPIAAGALCSHFGHCEQFVLFDVEEDGNSIGGRRVLTPPPHEPGSFPRWLHEQGVTVIIAGGMGARAQSLFDQNGIRVVVGASSGEPDGLVREFLDGRLATGANACDH
jgi:ATP-binding protein involved in chromosome partitioning